MSTTNEPSPVTYNTGDALRNGCTVVDFNRDTRIVLAKSTDRFCGGTSMPYITWAVTDCGATGSGCYYNTLAEAAVDAKRGYSRSFSTEDNDCGRCGADWRNCICDDDNDV